MTGYGAFGKILTNPTTVLVNKIKENLKKFGIKPRNTDYMVKTLKDIYNFKNQGNLIF